MPKKIFKHIRVFQQCKSCGKEIKENRIVPVKTVSTKQIEKQLKKSVSKMCTCDSGVFKTTYSFYHVQKL